MTTLNIFENTSNTDVINYNKDDDLKKLNYLFLCSHFNNSTSSLLFMDYQSLYFLLYNYKFDSIPFQTFILQNNVVEITNKLFPFLKNSTKQIPYIFKIIFSNNYFFSIYETDNCILFYKNSLILTCYIISLFQFNMECNPNFDDDLNIHSNNIHQILSEAYDFILEFNDMSNESLAPFKNFYIYQNSVVSPIYKHFSSIVDHFERVTRKPYDIFRIS